MVALLVILPEILMVVPEHVKMLLLVNVAPAITLSLLEMEQLAAATATKRRRAMIKPLTTFSARAFSTGANWKRIHLSWEQRVRARQSELIESQKTGKKI